MIITTRTLVWLGLLVTLFSGAALGIIVWNVPPSTGPLILFFVLTFLTVTGLVQSFIAGFQTVRGFDHPARALRQSIQIGLAVTVLVILQYFDALTFITGGSVIVLSIVLEILLRMAKPTPPSPSFGSPQRSTHTMASQSSRGVKRKRKK